MSLVQPTTVVNSTDVQIQQLFALANEEGEELARSFDWQALRQQYTFLTQSTDEQVGAVPDDWDRFIANSFFNRSTRRQLLGPITPQQYQAILAQPQLNRVYLAFIERSGEFLITPQAPDGQTIAYEYISKNWAKSATGVPQDQFLADADTAYISERIITLGVRWRFLSAKGLDYAEAMRTYEREREKLAGRDGGNTEMSITGSDSFMLDNIQEGNFAGPGF